MIIDEKTAIIGADTYKGGVSPEQVIWGSGSNGPVLMRGSLHVMTRPIPWQVSRTDLAVFLFFRYFRRIKFNAYTRRYKQTVGDKRRELCSRLKTKHWGQFYYTEHHSFVGRFHGIIWIDGERYYDDDGLVMAAVRSYRRNKNLSLFKEKIAKAKEESEQEMRRSMDAYHAEKQRLEQARERRLQIILRQRGALPLPDRTRKWKAAYDALREMGIKI